jgi:tetratricopeptide (TPR) repeat protein
VDEEKQCLDCGVDFLFSAEEQKYWYERLQFNFYSKPIHCHACRHKRRNARVLKIEMTEAANATKEKSDDAESWLRFAEATYQYFQYFGEGNLNRAIFAARQALRLSPQLSAALYWEAACQDGAGYFRRARDNYQKFLLVPSQRKQDKSLKRRAEQRLAELAEFVEDENEVV